MLGLDGAGKTTILYRLRLGEIIPSIPTIGFNLESVTFGENRLTVWDVGGQDKIRPLWKHYFADADALIFVIDSGDEDRFEEASEELFRIMTDAGMTNLKAILVLANKQDLPSARSVPDIERSLNLSRYGKLHHVQGASATMDEGITDGLMRLLSLMKSKS
jgi:small GTP-binding protein